jgi:hypothetical protein
LSAATGLPCGSIRWPRALPALRRTNRSLFGDHRRGQNSPRNRPSCPHNGPPGQGGSCGHATWAKSQASQHQLSVTDIPGKPMALNELAALMKADQKTDISRQSLGHHTAMSARTNFALGQLSFSTNVRFAPEAVVPGKSVVNPTSTCGAGRRAAGRARSRSEPCASSH